MSNLKNRVQLIGHLGADPEIKNLNNGGIMANLRIATTERYQTNGEWKEETQWHRLVAWTTVAERAAKQLHKGSFVLVEGKLVNRSYETDQGEKRYITEVRIDNFVSLDKKSDTNSQESEE